MKKILTLFLVLTLIVSFTACSKKAEETDTDPNNDVEVEENDDGQDIEEEEKEEEEEGWNPSGHVIIGTPNFNGEFISGWGNNSYDGSIRKLVFGGASTSPAGLMTSNEGGQIVLNSIVEKRDISDDGLVHTFKLKPDMVYSDGTPLDADDVVFTYEFYMDKEALGNAAGSSDKAEYIDSVKKVDDLTVEFTMKQKFYATDATFVENIISEEWVMKDKPDDKTVQQHVKDKLISKPLGYGPYKIVEYKENQYVKLTVNENFVGNINGIKPEIKDLVVKVVSNETDIDELLTGNIDILPGVVEAEKIDSAKADSNFAHCNYPRHGYGVLAFHTDFGPVRHKEVRQAIAYTIDRVVFREAFLGKYAVSTDGPYSVNYWMIDQDWVDNNLIKYTADKAKVDEILSGAGWAKDSDGIWAKDGERLEIEVATPGQNWSDTLNLTLGKTGEEFGIKFNVALLDFAVMLNHYYGKEISDVNDRKYHMFALASGLGVVFDGYPDWHSDNIGEPWGSSISTNSARFKNDKNDELLLTIRTAASDEIYQNAYRDWVKLMNDEMPVLPLYSNDYHDLYNKKIKGFKTSALWDWEPAIVESTLD